MKTMRFAQSTTRTPANSLLVKFSLNNKKCSVKDISLTRVDRIFRPECLNYDVYSIVEPVVKLGMDGYNGVIVTYGQTSSGELCIIGFKYTTSTVLSFRYTLDHSSF